VNLAIGGFLKSHTSALSVEADLRRVIARPEMESRMKIARNLFVAMLLVVASACGGGAVKEPRAGEPPPMTVADTLAVARAYAQAERLQDAITQYEKARSMGAAGRDESAELASVYDIAGDYANAERIYREWLAKSPDDAEFAQQLGLTLLL
jgi:tetratricopeptide (TPR) repeat protein